jgi:hypothetical protein
MAQYEDSYSGTLEAPAKDINAWAVGFILLGSVMMMLLGSFHLIAGIAALIDDSFYSVRDGFALEMDVTAWGWLHIIGGILLMVVSVALIGGLKIARLIAIALVAISAIWNFYSIPYYPVWSLTMLVLCLGVLWALIAHGREFTDVMNEPEGP